jgi:hypothetical protein
MYFEFTVIFRYLEVVSMVTTYVVIGTDWMGTCKSYYYAITTTAAPTKYLSKIYP